MIISSVSQTLMFLALHVNNHRLQSHSDFARLEKLAMILKLILSVAFPGIFKAVAGGIIDLSFFCSRVAAKIKAAQFLAGFLMSDFAEQL